MILYVPASTLMTTVFAQPRTVEAGGVVMHRHIDGRREILDQSAVKDVIPISRVAASIEIFFAFWGKTCVIGRSREPNSQYQCRQQYASCHYGLPCLFCLISFAIPQLESHFLRIRTCCRPFASRLTTSPSTWSPMVIMYPAFLASTFGTGAPLRWG
jgi:hypothetical protein